MKTPNWKNLNQGWKIGKIGLGVGILIKVIFFIYLWIRYGFNSDPKNTVEKIVLVFSDFTVIIGWASLFICVLEIIDYILYMKKE